MMYAQKSLSQLLLKPSPVRSGNNQGQDYSDYAAQLQKLQELQKARMHRRRFLQGQVERHLLVENDLIHLANARRHTDTSQIAFTPAQQLASLRQTNKALRLKLRQKEKLIQTLLKSQERPGQKSQLQAMLTRNKQYLEQIKLRNLQFKHQMSSLYCSDPRSDTHKVAQLKRRLGQCSQRLQQYQHQQLKLRQKLDEKIQQNSELSGENFKYKSVLGQYERELSRYKEQCSENMEERLTFLLTENTHSAIAIDNLQSENIKLKEEVERYARALEVSQRSAEELEKELQQTKMAFKEVKERYAGVVEDREAAKEEVANLEIQVRNLETLRQLQLEEMQDKEAESKEQEQQKSCDDLRVLKQQYDGTIKQLTQQNQQLVKQLEGIFQLKSRNQEEHLKTLKLQEQMQSDLVVLQNRLREVEANDMKAVVSRLQIQNVRLTGERQQLIRQLKETKQQHQQQLQQQQQHKIHHPPQAFIGTTTSNTSQHRLSDIQPNANESQHQDNNQLQFLKDQLQSGHKNLNLIKQQLQIAEHQDRIKGGEIRKLVAKINQLQGEIEEYREFRENLDEKVTEMNERMRSKADEVEELLDKNARLSQKVFENGQKFAEMKARLEEEVRFKIGRIQQLEGQLAEKATVELKDDQLAVAKDEIMRLNQQIAKLQEEAKHSEASRESLFREIENGREIQKKLADQIQELQRRKSLLEKEYQKHRQITDNFSAERQSLKAKISTLSQQSISNTKQIQRLGKIAEELLTQINTKDNQLKILLTENTKIKIETKSIIADIKAQQKQHDQIQQQTIHSLIEKIEKNKVEVDQLKKKLEEREKEMKIKQAKEQQQQQQSASKQAQLQRSGSKKDFSQKEEKALKKQSKGARPDVNNHLPHDYIILIKDLEKTIKSTKLITESKKLNNDEDNLNILRQAQMLITELSKQLRTPHTNPQKHEEQLLLNSPQAEIQILEKQNSNLKAEFEQRQREYQKTIKSLEEIIASKEKQFVSKISLLQSQLSQIKVTAQQRQSINWSDLKDVNADLQYSDSTLKRGSVKSQDIKSQLVQSLQNLQQRNQARRNFQQQLLELISKHLNFNSSKLAQLTFEFSSNLFLYPNHMHLMDFMEKFLEGLRFYEEFESKKNIQLRSTFMEYYGKAEELLQDPISEPNLLSDSLELFPVRATGSPAGGSQVHENRHQPRKMSKSTSFK